MLIGWLHPPLGCIRRTGNRGDAQGGRQPLLWGEPPAFGGVGGTLPPRLSPTGGKPGKGVSKFLAAAGDYLRLTPEIRTPPVPPASLCHHLKAGIPSFRCRPCAGRT